MLLSSCCKVAEGLVFFRVLYLNGREDLVLQCSSLPAIRPLILSMAIPFFFQHAGI